MIKHFILIIFIGLTSCYHCQQTNLEVYPLYGTLFNHSRKAVATINEPTVGIRFAYTKRPRKASQFFEKFNYPAIGIAVNAARYGNNEVFGNSFGAMTTLTFYLLEKERINLHIVTGIGAGYVTREHENSLNFQNTVIGSNFNLSASILTGLEYRMTDNIYLKPSIGILHYSNGRTTLPNLGTNFVFGSIGISHRINEKYRKDSFINNKKFVKQFKNEISLCPGISDRGGYFQNVNAIRNIILPSYSIHYSRLFYTGKIHVLKVGISGEYKNNDYDPEYNLLEFKDNADLAITFGNEIFFGRTSFHFTFGAYLYSYYQASKFAYQRWGISYRLPLKSDKIGMSIGAQLKVHRTAAELTEAKFALLF